MKKIFAFLILFLLFTQIALAGERQRYLVFAKRAAIRGVLLMDISWDARYLPRSDLATPPVKIPIPTKELENIVFSAFAKEKVDGVDIKELSNAEITTREQQEGLGNQSGLSLGNIGHTQTFAQWEAALGAEYPDMFTTPNIGVGP